MLAKNIRAKIKRAYYYFGFEEVVSYEKVRRNIDILLENADDESLSTKVKEYESEIEEFFNTSDKREDSDFSEEFAKDEPRKSWESYTEDFPEDIFSGDVESSGDIEPAAEAVEDFSSERISQRPSTTAAKYPLQGLASRYPSAVS
jgi:hypothetical protein